MARVGATGARAGVSDDALGKLLRLSKRTTSSVIALHEVQSPMVLVAYSGCAMSLMWRAEGM